MLMNFDVIFECEKKYLECFCKISEQQDCIRFRDELMPDMYSHNFTWIKNIQNDISLIQFIETEIVNNKGRNFCKIRYNRTVNDSILNKLLLLPEISISGYYVYDNSSIVKPTIDINCSIKRIDKLEMIQGLLLLDLEHDEETLGEDFCTRRVNRKKDIYLSDGGVNSFLYYLNEEAIGNCDLFIFNNIAKIEDFAVSPRKQRKGYVSKMLNAIKEIALKEEASTMYLETDEADTAKELYKKNNFYKVYEITDLLFKI